MGEVYIRKLLPLLCCACASCSIRYYSQHVYIVRNTLDVIGRSITCYDHEFSDTVVKFMLRQSG